MFDVMILNHVRKSVFSFLIFVCISSISFGLQAEDAKAGAIPSDDATISAGKTLFENNCKTCHAATDEIVVGPGLKGILNRRQLPWLQKWIRNSQQVIASGDPYAVELFNKYNKSVMSSFPSFKDEEIVSILAYVKSQESVKVAGPVAATGATTATASQDSSSKYINYILAGFLIILAIVLVILVLIISILTRFLNQKELSEEDKYLVNQKVDFGAVFKSNAFKIALGFLFVAVVGKAAIDGAMTIGIQQGYAPSQPIAFSHKLHAGKYKIDCNYCHTGVNKSKSANIPSSNICMNCHNVIKTESPKLVKLRNAWETGKPIEWVRVHNLPDLAYFNHSQHVKVGGIACQQCHGPIETMEVVQQYAPLTMGWCINCHRETAIKTEGNAYYNKLVLMHQKKSKQPMTVADNGGLECSKCHY